MSVRVMRLYSNCIIAKGAVRAAICDLQRRKYYLVPLELAALFQKGYVLHYEELKEQLDEDDAAIFSEYVRMLEENELAFFCTEEELQHFPELSVAWDFPAKITHCVIDMNKEETWLDETSMAQLAALGCNYIELRIYNYVSRDYLQYIAKLIADTQVKSIDLLVKDESTADFYTYLMRFADTNRKIRNITVHHAAANKQLKSANEGFGAILAVREQITGSIHCGVVHHVYFSVNIESYTESLQYNSCLNRKIAIDADGYIKNCPSMAKNFGHISDTKLADAVAMPGFSETWNISKDQINVCRDCEFRHICTDCRAYTEHPGDLYSKPLKCGYDPYTAVWEEWSTHPLKQNAIEHYGMQQLFSADEIKR
ncbi:grasp-with-spasm system SPASM domain peptide maturase [Chitinophagaceae bacterium MMS25-I14]